MKKLRENGVDTDGLWQARSKNSYLSRNVKRFRRGLVFKAHRRVYHSTLGLRVIEKKRRKKAGVMKKLRENGVDTDGLWQAEP